MCGGETGHFGQGEQASALELRYPITPSNWSWARPGCAGRRELRSEIGEHVGVEQLSDAEVISASCVDPAAFGTVFDRHATVLHRYLVRRVGAVEADPILGDLFLIVSRNAPRSRPTANPPGRGSTGLAPI